MKRQVNASLAGGSYGAKAITLTQYDQFLDYLVAQATGDSSAADLYKTVAWMFWCVGRRANAIARMPHLILPMETEEDDPDAAVEFGLDLSRTLWPVEAWLSLHGAAYALKRETPDGLDLQVLNALTMRVKEYDADGPTVFEQRAGGKVQLFPADDIIYFRTFNTSDDVGPGTAPGEVASLSGSLIKSSNEYLSGFFRNGAVPLFLLTAEGNPPDSERDRIRGAIDKVARGVKNAFSTLILGHGLKPTVLSPPVGDLAMPELSQDQTRQILASFGLPPGLAVEKASLAERQAQQLEAFDNCYLPEWQVWIEPVLNEQLFNERGLRIVERHTELEIYQAQELQKAEGSSFVVSGIMLPAYKENTVNVDEVRRVIDSVLQAASLPPLDEQFEPEERTPPALAPFTGQQPPEEDDGGVEGGPTPIDERIESRMPKAMLDDLGRWERKAITRIKEGAPIKALEFASDAIPAVMHRMIVHGLEYAVSLADVQEVFKAARGEKAVQFVPEGQGDPLPPVPAEVTISEADIDRAIRDWNKHMPDFAGLLDAEVIHRENYEDA